MPSAIPASTKTSLGQRLRQRQRDRWPALASVAVRFRGRFAYVDGELGRRPGPAAVPAALQRLGQPVGLAVYLASKDGCEDSVLPSGLPIGAPEEALDCACGLYLNDPAPGRSTLHQPAPDHARTSIRQH
jgi:hypothetical protein